MAHTSIFNSSRKAKIGKKDKIEEKICSVAKFFSRRRTKFPVAIPGIPPKLILIRAVNVGPIDQGLL